MAPAASASASGSAPAAPPTMRAACVCNNRGGVGKSFLTFQTATAVAAAHPTKRVLVLDFSIYADVTSMLLGGTGAERLFEAARGLTVCRANVPAAKRVEGLLAALSRAAPARAAPLTPVRPRFGGLFGGGVVHEATVESTAPDVDLAAFATRARDHNPHVPDNVYVVASAGADSFPASDAPPAWEQARRETGIRLARAVEALSDEWVAVLADTDHIASSPLTMIALAACDAVVVPCPTDTAEFQRLYKTPDAQRFPGVESLFEDVMLSMHAAGDLRARVSKMVFCKVTSSRNEPSVTPGGIHLAFTPNDIAARQMDSLARLAHDVLTRYPQYRPLFLHGDEDSTAFIQRTFTGFRAVAELPRSISAQAGVAICSMTTQTYAVPGGRTGSVSAPVLAALKEDITSLLLS